MLLPRRLSSQLALLVSVLFTATVFFFAWYAAGEQAKRSESERAAQLHVLTRGLATAVSGPLAAGDQTTVERLLMQAAEYPSILEIVILDAERRPLSRIARDERGQPFVDFASAPASAQRGGLDAGTGGAERKAATEHGEVTVVQPVIAAGTIGWLAFSFVMFLSLWFVPGLIFCLVLPLVWLMRTMHYYLVLKRFEAAMGVKLDLGR